MPATNIPIRSAVFGTPWEMYPALASLGFGSTEGKLKVSDASTLLGVVNLGPGDVRVTVLAQKTTKQADSRFPLQAVADKVFTLDDAPDTVVVIGPFLPAYIDSAGYVQVVLSPVDAESEDFNLQATGLGINPAG